MRVEQSSTAIEMYSIGRPASPEGGDPAALDLPFDRDRDASPLTNWKLEGGTQAKWHGSTENFAGDGLLHDARNLVSAIGLYCDLLSMPGVLKPEHRKYAEELRLLGNRSQQMIEHLMRSLAVRPAELAHPELPASLGSLAAPDNRAGGDRNPQPSGRTAPVTLRSVVERCSGLLSRVADGRAIEVNYGPAAEVPVRIAEESVERILVNLVRNGSAALGEENAAIRIAVGPSSPASDEVQPWPFQRVRLVVEDAGCGMDSRQLESLLSGGGPVTRGNHGIGFRVVRELVSASNGKLRVASAQGIGTRIQIDWPMAGTAANERGNAGMLSESVPARGFRRAADVKFDRGTKIDPAASAPAQESRVAN